MLIKCFAAGLIALGAAAPAIGQMVTAQDPQSVASAMQAAGYQAKVGKDRTGDPMIESNASGTRFVVFFYNCTGNRDCATVQFHSAWKMEKPIAVDLMNSWNKGNRFSRAYLDNENDPTLEHDLDLDDGGLSQALFTDNLEFWVTALHKFERHIGYRN